MHVCHFSPFFFFLVSFFCLSLFLYTYTYMHVCLFSLSFFPHLTPGSRIKKKEKCPFSLSLLYDASLSLSFLNR